MGNIYDDELQALLKRMQVEADRKHKVDLSITQQLFDLISNFEYDRDMARRMLYEGLDRLVAAVAPPEIPQPVPQQPQAKVQHGPSVPPPPMPNGRGADPRAAINNLRREGMN